MNITRAQSIDGWMFDDELAYLASVAARSHRIVEIGSWLGRSTVALAANVPEGGVVYAVDTWRGTAEQPTTGALDEEQGNDLYERFLHNVAGLPVIPTRARSLDAVRTFAAEELGPFDVIFIDAEHEYEAVSADIAAWKPLLREGGILCGHDYHELWWGVRKAVDEQVGRFRTVNTIWTTEI